MITEKNLFVSIIVPCRNEENSIGRCLDSIIASDFPKDRLEVLIVDGMSTDKTKEIISVYTEQYPFIKHFDNKKMTIPAAMNIGIQNAKGEVIMKCDAHAHYAKNYISKCLKYMVDYDADNVGGIIRTLPQKNTLIGNAIVSALTSQFGVGNSVFRLGCKEPLWADTAFSGCYKKEIFEKIGLYDENIARSEDFLLNLKLRTAGGKILLVPQIISHYYARSNLFDFIKHNFNNGFWITYPLKYGKALFSLRHLIPFVFTVYLSLSFIIIFFFPILKLPFFFIIGLYCLANLYFSFKIVIQKKKFWNIVLMPIIFFILHVGYGLGSIWGLLKTVSSGQFWKNLRWLYSIK